MAENKENRAPEQAQRQAPNKIDLQTGWLTTRKPKKHARPPLKAASQDAADLTTHSKRKRDADHKCDIVPESNKYCCLDCKEWYTGDPLYASDKDHLQRTGRHKNSRRAGTPPDEWKKWDISFPDTDDDN